MNKFDLYHNHFKITFWLIMLAEIASFWGNQLHALNNIIFALIVVGTFIISLRRLEYGFWIVSVELFIGSFGYLFSYPVGDFRLSVRLGIFVALILAWLIRSIRIRSFNIKEVYPFWPLVAVGLVLGMGIAVALLHGNSLKNVFFDFNAYLYVVLIFIAFSVLTSWQRVNEWLQVLMASTLAIAIKTLFLLFYFSHQVDAGLFQLMYRWIRDTRVGEIAPVTHNYYRVFFQSHIWQLFALFILMLLLVLIGKGRGTKGYLTTWGLTLLYSSTLIISFSRSIWLGMGVTLLLLLIFLKVKEGLSWQKLGQTVMAMAGVAIVGLGITTFLVNVPLPGQSGAGLSVTSLIQERITTTQEAAVVSRFSLLKPLATKFFSSPIIGSGFGTTISYQTLDPRTKEKNGGVYTTYAFEWGYLDIGLKIGGLGLVVFLFFIWKIFQRGVRQLTATNREEGSYKLILGLLFSIIALGVVHFTTPYLNHPLGIYLLIVCAAVFSLPASATNKNSPQLE